MSLDIALTFHAYEGLPARWKWDQFAVARMLSGEEGRPPGGYRFVETPWTPEDGLGRVLVMPTGDYKRAGVAHRVPGLLKRDLDLLPWCLMIATSDECSTFPWQLVDPWPEHVRLWVMTPKPSLTYPHGTRFIGEGSPIPAKLFPDVERDLDLFFAGQIGSNDRRRLALPAIRAAVAKVQRVQINVTDGFLHSRHGDVVSAPGADEQYVNDLASAWVAPCPAGTCTQDSFRFFEALEAGCIPVVDDLSQQGDARYWEMLGLDKVAPRIGEWRDLPVMVEALLRDRHATAAHVASRWQQYKRSLRAQLHDDVEQLSGIRLHEPPHDAITVLVVTSPVPSNPDLSMVQGLIESVRESLPEAEILIGCDTPREEMAHRTANYHVFLHDLCVWANTEFNVTVFTSHRHSHESGLLQMLMPEVRTSHVLFMEHDCPLIQPVDFQGCLDEMSLYGLRHLRFGHERHVLDEHAYLYPFGIEPAGNHIKTVQYSSRPALYTTELMNELLATYFDPEATCMIESVLYGGFQHDDTTDVAQAGPDKAFADRLRLQGAWSRYRSALWAPGQNLAFSGHLDGRDGDPNVPILIKYPDGVVPPGAPQPGETQI